MRVKTAMNLEGLNSNLIATVKLSGSRHGHAEAFCLQNAARTAAHELV